MMITNFDIGSHWNTHDALLQLYDIIFHLLKGYSRAKYKNQ